MTTNNGSENYFNAGAADAERQQQIFTGFFNGIMLGDAGELSWAAQQLRGQRGYAFQSVIAESQVVIDSLREETSEVHQENIEHALRHGIRAYEYANTAFNPDLVSFAVDRSGFDRLWLDEVVRPTNFVLTKVLGVSSKPERSRLRQKGYRAMGALGLTGRFRRYFTG